MAALLVPGLVVCIAAAGAACGGDDDGGGTRYGSLSGNIRVDGSSTVFPISEAVAEEFSLVARRVRVNVGLSGTGGGFEKFCRGEIQVSDASRSIKASEVQACADEGITDIVELEVAIDALTVAINRDNTWATCLTPAQLHYLFKDGGARKWSDIDPSWPARSIQFFYPGADSGTFDYFDEKIIGEDARHRGDGTASEDDNVLLKAVASDKNAIAYFGFAYYQEAGEDVKAVEVDDGGGCVPPTVETAVDGSYSPLSRPVFIYTRESLVRDRPEIAAFIEFYLDSLEILVPEVGYITMSESTLAAQRAKIAPLMAE
jgi:phosphate transport system substrate-binding protein